MSECERLAHTLAERGTGKKLLDVKFYVGNPSEVAHERLCDEVNRVYAALSDGACEDLRLPKI
jgi:hypothetical protein